MSSPANDYASREGLHTVCKVVETIEQPVEVVWALVSAFGAIKAWIPAIATCIVLKDRPQPPSYGAVRLANASGSELEEILEIWDAKNHFISY
ncbi:hypothetical protein HBI25_208690 [Parastagonospora nodorum]|nr:hypothetical protein HBI95_207460 [Parastagonospora nodorum]KAH4802681.1 hypothetical protein HBH61_185020 [Parastagonospora nodorum]KAH4913868.1 hypothetical protein HBH74_157350 [Parastagonospora nodorum]KAH4921621.1 hypothetical protein HBI79_183700 [Parastagonospora nodorum]KAH4939880.1 hypothetical protein HBH73_158070 [Parastagonospora nodorum]